LASLFNAKVLDNKNDGRLSEVMNSFDDSEFDWLMRFYSSEDEILTF